MKLSASSIVVSGIAVVISAIFTSGCGNANREIYPVSGFVRFGDGQLLRQGSVEFETTGREKPITARGTINPDGSFVLGTYQRDDGAFVGIHRAVVISDYEIGNSYERPWLIPKEKLHPKYRSFSTSELVFEVKPQANDFRIEVEYAAETP
jgi:hypothetical protein